MICSIIKKTAV